MKLISMVLVGMTLSFGPGAFANDAIVKRDLKRMASAYHDIKENEAKGMYKKNPEYGVSAVERMEKQIKKWQDKGWVSDLSDWTIETKERGSETLDKFLAHVQEVKKGFAGNVVQKEPCFKTQYKVFEAMAGGKWKSEGLNQWIRKSKSDCDDYEAAGYVKVQSQADTKKYVGELRKDCKKGDLYTRGWMITDEVPVRKRMAIVVCQEKAS